jgi:hypothetical protein
VTSSIQTKKKQIQKEKDQLDTADSSILMNSHALTAIAAPGSPSGFHNNRKTRNTRQRHENEILETGEVQKRKRKAHMDLDHESHVPMLRHGSIDAFGTLLWERSRGAPDLESTSAVCSVENFFNPKELAAHNRSAVNTVAQDWSDKRSRKTHYGLRVTNGDHFPNGDLLDTEHRGINTHDTDAELEDASNLIAPTMERAGSHATRSARINNLELLAHRDNMDDDDPQRSYGIAVLDASLARSKVAQSKDMEAPMTTGMTQQDITDDLSIMQSLVEDD